MASILIIKLGALGDVVMSTPLVDAIVRHHRPQAVHLLTTPLFVPLFEAWPDLAVTALARRGWASNLAAVRLIRALGARRIYDLQGNDRSALWCALSGAPERVGNHNRYPYTHHPAEPWRGQCHIFERMRAVLASAGITAVGALPVLPHSAADAAHVARWCRSHDLETGRFAVLHAGASANRPGKVWPHFGALAARLAAHGLAVVWLGAEPDRARNAALAASAGIDATSAFSLPQLATLGTRARFAVTNDSGPMHVLSASRIPVFGLFGPSSWRRNHALGQGARAIACVDCDPRLRGAEAGDCLEAISVDHVWSRLRAEALV